MQYKTLYQLAIIYRETNSENAFLETQKRLRPLIQKRSSGARQISSTDDIEQTAALAIALSVINYDPAKGCFQAFATAFIIGEINRQSAAVQIVHSPEGDTDRVLLRGNRAKRFVQCEMSQGRTHAQAVALAAEWFDVPACKIEAALQGVQRAANEADGIAEDAKAKGREIEDQCRAIGSVMSCLTERERIVIEMRLHADGAPTKYEAGKILGVHYSNVSKIARRAMDKMKVALAEQGIHASDLIA